MPREKDKIHSKYLYYAVFLCDFLDKKREIGVIMSYAENSGFKSTVTYDLDNGVAIKDCLKYNIKI